MSIKRMISKIGNVHHIKSHFLNYENDVKLQKEKTENSVKCSCGHSIFIPVYKDKVICTWCKRTVFNKTKNHFKYKLRKMKEGSDKE